MMHKSQKGHRSRAAVPQNIKLQTDSGPGPGGVPATGVRYEYVSRGPRRKPHARAAACRAARRHARRHSAPYPALPLVAGLGAAIVPTYTCLCSAGGEGTQRAGARRRRGEGWEGGSRLTEGGDGDDGGESVSVGGGGGVAHLRAADGVLVSARGRQARVRHAAKGECEAGRTSRRHPRCRRRLQHMLW